MGSFLGRMNPVANLLRTAAADEIQGSWSGITVAAFPQDGGPLFSELSKNAHCVLQYALAQVSAAASNDACATRCISSPSCEFYSYAGSEGNSTGFQDCATFQYCIVEPHANYTIWHMHPPAELVGARCGVELMINQFVVDLELHSCNAVAASDSFNNACKSAQAGALSGIILSAEPDG